VKRWETAGIKSYSVQKFLSVFFHDRQSIGMDDQLAASEIRE